MSTAPYQSEHLKSLTGLRFFAALSVFVAHVPGRWPQFDVGDLPYGAAGVGFFYVLSGFILTYVYGSVARRHSGSPVESVRHCRSSIDGRGGFCFREFYIRRFARIWPLHLVTLLISLFFVIGVEAFFNRPNPTGKLILNGLLLQSWIPNYQWIYSLNGPAWSLSVEAFFYFLFPFLLVGGARRFIGYYLAIIVGTIVAISSLGFFFPHGKESWVELNSIFHANPLMRLFEFATGVGCGFLHFRLQSGNQTSRTNRRDGSTREFIAVGALLCFFLSANWLGMYGVENKTGLPEGLWYWFRFSGACPVFALLVLTFANTHGWISKFLSNRLLVYLGEISYSFYMIHMGVLLVLVRENWIDGRWVSIGTVLCGLLISLSLASLLYHVVELPSRRALVDWMEKKSSRSVTGTFVGSLCSWARTPWFVAFVVAMIGSGWFVSAYRYDVLDSDRIQAIARETDPDIVNARFENDARLAGAISNQSRDGGLVLELAWHLKPGRRPTRFIKLLDRNQRVVGRGPSNREIFDRFTGDIVVIDRIRISADDMADVHFIAVGFFDPERKSAVVDRGPRSANGRQLHVWKLD